MSKKGWKFSQGRHNLVWSSEKHKNTIERHARWSSGFTRIITRVSYSIWTGRQRRFYDTLRDAINAAEEMG